jgi:hypothetical protein
VRLFYEDPTRHRRTGHRLGGTEAYGGQRAGGHFLRVTLVRILARPSVLNWAGARHVHRTYAPAAHGEVARRTGVGLRTETRRLPGLSDKERGERFCKLMQPRGVLQRDECGGIHELPTFPRRFMNWLNCSRRTKTYSQMLLLNMRISSAS